MKQLSTIRIVRFLMATGLVLGVAIMVVGCGGSQKAGNLEGEVTYEGKPVTGGTISLFNDQGNPVANGQIDPNGKYIIYEAPKGTWKVVVDTESAKAAQGYKVNVPDAKKFGKDMKKPALSANQGSYVAIPPKYRNVKTTDLKVDVKGGAQTENIALKK